MHPDLSSSSACAATVLPRWNMFFLLLLWSVVPGLAQTDEGEVTGRVRNANTGSYLEGVIVTLAGTQTKAVTARDGSFRLSRVPAGPHKVNVFYTGLDAQDVPVEVTGGQTAALDVALTANVYMLGEFTVTSQREGNAASLTKQRNAGNVVTILSMDTYGNVADGNIGNFLQKIASVAANKESGEIVGIGLRGTPPEQNAVTVDGVRSASAIAGFTPQGDRSALIDQIPSEFIKEIKVTKASTPDQWADSLGGSIDLITKSAFDFKERVFSYRAGANLNTYRNNANRWRPTGAFTYMDTFNGGKLGVALIGSYTETNNTRDRTQMEFRETADDRNSRARALDDINHRTRQGYGLKLEYRVDDTLSFRVDALVNRFEMDTDRVNYQASATGNRLIADFNVVSRAAIEAGAVPRTTAGLAAGIAPGFTPLFTEMLNADWINQVAAERKESDQVKYGLGFEKKWTDSSLKFAGSYNTSEFYDKFQGFTTTLRGIGLSIDRTASLERPVFNQTFGPTIGAGSDFSRYTAQRFEQPDNTTDDITAGSLDYTKEFRNLSAPVTFQAGAAYRRQERDIETFRPTWNFVGADGVAGLNTATGVNDDNLAQFVDSNNPHLGIFNGLFPDRDQLRFQRVLDLLGPQSGFFAPVGTSVSKRPPPSGATEEVMAAYVMAKIKFNQLTVTGGVRVEDTDVSSFGAFTDPLNPNQTVILGSDSYTKGFPSIHLRYEPLRNLIFRGSWSTSSARPGISSILPTTTISTSSGVAGTVTAGNPGLKPQYSNNYDLGAEYYFEPAGAITVGVFQKDVEDFITNVTSFVGAGPNNGFEGRFEGFNLNTTINAPTTAKIRGIEISYNQQFRFLPKPFNGLSVFANYTRLDTSGTFSFGSSQLPGFVPKTFNAGLGFAWRRFEIRGTYQYKSAFLLNANNANPALSTIVSKDPTVDVNFQYKWRPGLSLFVDVQNIFDQAPYWSTVNSRRREMSELYGARVSVGLSGRF